MNSTGRASGPLIDIDEARRALGAAARRNAKMIGSLRMDLPVGGSQWSVGDTATHLAVALRGFTNSAIGDDRQWRELEDQIPSVRTPERVEVLNRAMLAAAPRLDPAATAQAITDATDAFLAATATLSPEQGVPTPWYGDGSALTVAHATCLLLGEQVLHGYDIARSSGGDRSISTQNALLIFAAIREMLPKMADPRTIGNVSATYEFHVGRSTRFVVRVADGAAFVEPVAGQRIDCHVLAEPVALLLVGYGRISQWHAIGRLKMITWGTKPWLAFRFTSFFSNP